MEKVAEIKNNILNILHFLSLISPFKINLCTKNHNTNDPIPYYHSLVYTHPYNRH